MELVKPHFYCTMRSLFIISKGRRSLTLSWQLLADAANLFSQLLILLNSLQSWCQFSAVRLFVREVAPPCNTVRPQVD